MGAASTGFWEILCGHIFPSLNGAPIPPWWLSLFTSVRSLERTTSSESISTQRRERLGAYPQLTWYGFVLLKWAPHATIEGRGVPVVVTGADVHSGVPSFSDYIQRCGAITYIQRLSVAVRAPRRDEEDCRPVIAVGRDGGAQRDRARSRHPPNRRQR